jgi:hypothetical protein
MHIAREINKKNRSYEMNIEDYDGKKQSSFLWIMTAAKMSWEVWESLVFNEIVD